MKISVRKKATKTKGYHWYLDYNRPGRRCIFLNLYSFDEKLLGSKLKPQEKELNKETEIKVQAIWRKMVDEAQNETLRLYGVEVRRRMESKFLDYFDAVMKERELTSIATEYKRGF